MPKSVALEFNGDEAIVLFESLVEWSKSADIVTAEDVVRSRMLGQLEKALVEPFDPNYLQLLHAARRRIMDSA